MTPLERYRMATKKLASIWNFKTLTFRHNEKHAIFRRWERECEHAYRLAFPREKNLPKDWRSLDMFESIVNKYKAEADRLSSIVTAAEEKWTKERNAAANDVVVEPGEEWNLAHVASEYSYSTQPNARGYAAGEAKRKAMELRATGLNAEVRNLEVWAKASPEMIEIAKHKPPTPLREWVMACWKTGCNPRVMNPWLPHGYEESVEIDYFGNDLRKKKEQEQCQKTSSSALHATA